MARTEWYVIVQDKTLGGLAKKVNAYINENGEVWRCIGGVTVVNGNANPIFTQALAASR